MSDNWPPEVKEMYDRILKDPWHKFYMRQTIRGDRPYAGNVGGPKLKSAGNALTVREFTSLIWQCLKILRPDAMFVPAYPDFIVKNIPAHAIPNGIDPAEYDMWVEKYHEGEPVPKLIEDEIKKNIPVKSIPAETITWTVRRQVPGTVGSTPFNERRELKARLRDIIEVDSTSANSIKNNSIIMKKGQWMDNLIQFDLWTKDNSSAEDLAEWFKSFMQEYEGIFIERGIQKILFWERLRDETILKWRNGLVNRSLQWYVRTEEIVTRNIPKIREINIYLKKLEEQYLTLREANY